MGEGQNGLGRVARTRSGEIGHAPKSHHLPQSAYSRPSHDNHSPSDYRGLVHESSIYLSQHRIHSDTIQSPEQHNTQVRPVIDPYPH